MKSNPQLRLSVPLTVGQAPLPTEDLETLLVEKTKGCVDRSEPFFDLSVAQYNALKEYLISWLSQYGYLEDAAGNRLWEDQLDAIFEKSLERRIAKWCETGKSTHYLFLADLKVATGSMVERALHKAYPTPRRGRGDPHYGEGRPFEDMLADKVSQCQQYNQEFFDLSGEEYNALKEHMVLRLDRNNRLEDAAENVIPLDLLEAEFNNVLTYLIQRWCRGKVSPSLDSPYTIELYIYLENKIRAILKKVYGTQDIDIYAPELEEPYYERPAIFDEVSPLELQEGLQQLPDRERRVLELRFGLNNTTPLTLEQIGQELDLSRERIQQIEPKALERLRILLIQGRY